MAVTLETFHSPTEANVGEDRVATLVEIARESFSAEGQPSRTDVRRHVLDLVEEQDLTLVVATDEVPPGGGTRTVGFGSAYSVPLDTGTAVVSYGVAVRRDDTYAGENFGRVLMFAPVYERMAATASSRVYGRSQSLPAIRFWQSVGGYPRPNESTPERLRTFVHEAAEHFTDGDSTLDGHVLRSALDRQIFSDEDYHEWAPQIEQFLDGESFDPWNGDAVVVVAEPTVDRMRERLETAIENAGLTVEANWERLQ